MHTFVRYSFIQFLCVQLCVYIYIPLYTYMFIVLHNTVYTCVAYHNLTCKGGEGSRLGVENWMVNTKKCSLKSQNLPHAHMVWFRGWRKRTNHQLVSSHPGSKRQKSGQFYLVTEINNMCWLVTNTSISPCTWWWLSTVAVLQAWGAPWTGNENPLFSYFSCYLGDPNQHRWRVFLPQVLATVPLGSLATQKRCLPLSRLTLLKQHGFDNTSPSETIYRLSILQRNGNDHSSKWLVGGLYLSKRFCNPTNCRFTQWYYNKLEFQILDAVFFSLLPANHTLGLGLEQFLTSSWLPMWMIPHEVSRPPLVKCHKRVI